MPTDVEWVHSFERRVELLFTLKIEICYASEGLYRLSSKEDIIFLNRKVVECSWCSGVRVAWKPHLKRSSEFEKFRPGFVDSYET